MGSIYCFHELAHYALSQRRKSFITCAGIAGLTFTPLLGPFASSAATPFLGALIMLGYAGTAPPVRSIFREPARRCDIPVLS